MLLARFRRVTRDGRWIPEVDGLRFVAIAGVVLFHMVGELQHRSGAQLMIEPRYQWLFGMIANGDRGVRLFFVISGFILALPYARQFLKGGKPVSLRKFYLRRLTRLEPPYLISLALVAAMGVVYARTWPPGYFTHLGVSALYLHGLVYHSESWTNPVTWSLEVEIQFYLLAPLFMQVLRIRPSTLRRGLILAAVAVCGLIQMQYLWTPAAELTIVFYVQYFLAGLLLADVFTLEMDRIPESWAWDVVSIPGWLWVFNVDHDSHAAHAVLPFVFVVLCVGAFKSKGLRRLLATPWIAICGGMCYSIYLLHLTFIAAVFKVTRYAIVFHDFLANYLVQIAVTLIPVVLMCSVFYLLVERPCMDPGWPAKLWLRLTGRTNREVRALDTTGVAE